MRQPRVSSTMHRLLPHPVLRSHPGCYLSLSGGYGRINATDLRSGGSTEIDSGNCNFLFCHTKLPTITEGGVRKWTDIRGKCILACLTFRHSVSSPQRYDCTMFPGMKKPSSRVLPDRERRMDISSLLSPERHVEKVGIKRAIEPFKPSVRAKVW